MNIYKSGTSVSIKGINVSAIIIEVQLDFDAVSYKLSYFDGLKRTIEWFNEEEFTTEATKTKIGYK